MMAPKKDEHYVPKFVIKNYSDENEFVIVIDISSEDMRSFMRKPESILFEKHLYEVKNLDGTYFKRNAIEDRFSKMESDLSVKIKAILERQPGDEKLSGEEEAYLAFMFALQLVRLPKVKEIFFQPRPDTWNDPREHALASNTLYQMAVYSDQRGFDYLEQNGVALDRESRGKLGGENLLSTVMSYLLSNCFFYLMYVSEGDTFFLADNPVLIDEFEDAKYIYPITPKTAIGCCLFNTASESQLRGSVTLPRKSVEKINRYIINNTDRFVLCTPSDEGRLRECIQRAREISVED
jgi:hypothetical protein